MEAKLLLQRKMASIYICLSLTFLYLNPEGCPVSSAILHSKDTI